MLSSLSSISVHILINVKMALLFVHFLYWGVNYLNQPVCWSKNFFSKKLSNNFTIDRFWCTIKLPAYADTVTNMSVLVMKTSIRKHFHQKVKQFLRPFLRIYYMRAILHLDQIPEKEVVFMTQEKLPFVVKIFSETDYTNTLFVIVVTRFRT